MTALVIDASVAPTRSDVLDGAETLHAPELIDIEMANIVRKSVLRRERSIEHGAAVLSAWARNRVIRHSHAALLDDIWALRGSITPYDASYVALASSLGIPLVTADRRLAAAARSHCDVVVIERP
ncbi:type II toxin-antitoxin system VapC family toxin [Antiquaquibacter soli]|uniref:Ribonuclease VapC n=1 Tax=Antiquaquibacter soli TaxID=3064523 RepID=A0ABT9BNR0_9MICO|nr:type II toxin-antitoxin system VapC family toxin [Protaetiibacter sp. WY-16]MDO7882676.1 type II toxin-antitoxin system VapC family toxin [Protaetiibacter sp. WY-16]